MVSATWEIPTGRTVITWARVQGCSTPGNMNESRPARARSLKTSIELMDFRSVASVQWSDWSSSQIRDYDRASSRSAGPLVIGRITE